MADHVMDFVAPINAPATNDGFKLWVVAQATSAAVDNNDTLTFKDMDRDDIRIVSLSGDTGQVVNCDAKANSGADTQFTVDHPQVDASAFFSFGTLATGQVATSVQGIVLARRR